MFLGLKYGSNARYVVIVNERIQVLSSVKAPVLAAELTVDRVRDLEHIHIVEAGEQTLVALVVGNGIQHLGVHPVVVVAVKRLAEQEEVIGEPLAVAVQLLEEVLIETVRNVKTQTVNAELLFPACDNVLEVLLYLGVVEIDLSKLVVTLPALKIEAGVIV